MNAPNENMCTLLRKQPSLCCNQSAIINKAGGQFNAYFRKGKEFIDTFQLINFSTIVLTDIQFMGLVGCLQL